MPPISFENFLYTFALNIFVSLLVAFALLAYGFNDIDLIMSVSEPQAKKCSDVPVGDHVDVPQHDGTSTDRSDVPRTQSFHSSKKQSGSSTASTSMEKVQSETITQEIMEKSLSVLGHNSQGQVVFSCSTLKGLGLVDISKLSGYKFLQKIILDGNKLKSLDALRPLEFLVYLSASDNMLTDACFDCLLSCSANLEHLQLDKNQLRSLNGLHKLPYLINFSASGNEIHELVAENFSTIKSLMRVQLRENKIQHVEPHTFSGSQGIRLLDLSHNQIEDMLFTSYITENLESLYLSDNKVTRVGSSLSQCQSLVLLDLKNNLLDTVEELQNICPAPGLRKLYVTGNPFKETTKELTASITDCKLSRSEVIMDDTLVPQGTQTILSMGSTRKKIKSPNLPYAALTARHTYGRIRSVVAAANVVNIPLNTDKLGELHRMPLETQARLRILNILPQLTILNGVLVTPEDVARSVAYFEAEVPYFPADSTESCPADCNIPKRCLTDEGSDKSVTQELRTPPNLNRSTPSVDSRIISMYVFPLFRCNLTGDIVTFFFLSCFCIDLFLWREKQLARMGGKRPREDEMRFSGEAWISGNFTGTHQQQLPRYFCPLCFSSEMEKPVLFHPMSNSPRSCLACQNCVRFLQRIGEQQELEIECAVCNNRRVSIADLNADREATEKELLNCNNFCAAVNNNPTGRPCGACEHGKAQNYCLQCGFALCTGCKDSMHSQKCFQHHTVVPTSEVLSIPEKCEEHPGQTKDLFCKACRCTGCVLCCFSGKHRGHEAAPVCEVAAMTTECVANAIRSSKEMASSARDRKEQLHQCRRSFQKAVKSRQLCISESFEQMRKALDEREAELQNELQDSTQLLLSNFDCHAQLCDDIEQRCSKDTESFSALLGGGESVLAHILVPFQHNDSTQQRLRLKNMDSVSRWIDKTENMRIKNDFDNVLGKFSLRRSDQTAEEYDKFLDRLRSLGQIVYSSDCLGVNREKNSSSAVLQIISPASSYVAMHKRSRLVVQPKVGTSVSKSIGVTLFKCDRGPSQTGGYLSAWPAGKSKSKLLNRLDCLFSPVHSYYLAHKLIALCISSTTRNLRLLLFFSVFLFVVFFVHSITEIKQSRGSVCGIGLLTLSAAPSCIHPYIKNNNKKKQEFHYSLISSFVFFVCYLLLSGELYLELYSRHNIRMSLLRINPVLQQYREQREESSSESENGFVDLDAFEDIIPESHPGTQCTITAVTKRAKPTLLSSSSDDDHSHFSERNQSFLAIDEGCANGRTEVNNPERAAPTLSLSPPGEQLSPETKYLVEEKEEIVHDTEKDSKTLLDTVEVAEPSEVEPSERIPSSSFRKAPSLSHVDAVDDGATIPISFWEALVLLRADTQLWKRYAPPLPIPTSKKKGLFSSFCTCPEVEDDVAVQQRKWEVAPKAEPTIAEDLSFFRALLHIPFDYDNIVLHRVLFTIYHSIAAPHTLEPWYQRKNHRISAMQAPLVTDVPTGLGSPMSPCKVAWDRIGFQGTDPATDLRSTGLLGLLQILYLIDQYPGLNALLWQVCRGSSDGGQGTDTILGEELPYALVGFNLTSFVVDALTRGSLQDEVRAMGSGTNVVDGMAISRASKLEESDMDYKGYCTLTPEEHELATKYPVVCTSCEFFVGCVHGFVQAWLRISREKHPQKLTVADFHDVRNLLVYKWNRKGKKKDIFFGAAESRLLLQDKHSSDG
eukprot:gene5057-3644_t